jgi:hypothetical protein
MRLTIACPEALRDDANHFAMALGLRPVQEVIPMDSAGFVISWLVKVSK